MLTDAAHSEYKNLGYRHAYQYLAGLSGDRLVETTHYMLEENVHPDAFAEALDRAPIEEEAADISDAIYEGIDQAWYRFWSEQS